MSPKPQIRTLKKKPTAPTETNSPSVDTEMDTSETIEQGSTKTKTKTVQPVPSSEEEVTETTTTGKELKEETDKATSDVTAIATVSEKAEADTDPEASSDTGDQSTDDPDADTDKPIFQAIGTIKGKAQKDDEGNFFLRLGGKRYSLFFAGYRYQAWLKQAEAHPEQTLFFRVYPKCLMIPRKQPLIYFQVAAWQEENQWEEQAGQFRLKGIWQFVPQSRTPVISIYRNHNAEDPKGKFKATHIPVLMRRNDEAAPFRFNPKMKKEDLPPRWFVQGLFKFIPSRDCFGFSEDLEPPTKKIPYYKKPVKAVPGQDSVQGTEHKSMMPSKKGTENKSQKPSGNKLEKPQKKSEKPSKKDLEVSSEDSNNE